MGKYGVFSMGQEQIPLNMNVFTFRPLLWSHACFKGHYSLVADSKSNREKVPHFKLTFSTQIKLFRVCECTLYSQPTFRSQ